MQAAVPVIAAGHFSAADCGPFLAVRGQSRSARVLPFRGEMVYLVYGENPPWRQRLPSREKRSLRRGACTGSLLEGYPGKVHSICARLPRGGMRFRHSAGNAPPYGRPEAAAPGDGPHGHRSHRPHEGLGRVCGSAELEHEDLSGFIFKSGSPSSGMARVRVYDDRGVPRKVGVGVFARIFMEHFPLTPVEEDGRLHDPILRENFIDRIFTCRRYREIREEKNRIRSIVDFHTSHKLLLMAYSPRHLQQMGQLVAHARELPAKELIGRYERLLMEAMALKSSTRKHTDVLHHMMGYFKKNLSADEKQELIEVIDEYRRGTHPPDRPDNAHEPLCEEIPRTLPERANLSQSPPGGVATPQPRMRGKLQ